MGSDGYRHVDSHGNRLYVDFDDDGSAYVITGTANGVQVVVDVNAQELAEWLLEEFADGE